MVVALPLQLKPSAHLFAQAISRLTRKQLCSNQSKRKSKRPKTWLSLQHSSLLLIWAKLRRFFSSSSQASSSGKLWGTSTWQLASWRLYAVSTTGLRGAESIRGISCWWSRLTQRASCLIKTSRSLVEPSISSIWLTRLQRKLLTSSSLSRCTSSREIYWTSFSWLMRLILTESTHRKSPSQSARHWHKTS